MLNEVTSLLSKLCKISTFFFFFLQLLGFEVKKGVLLWLSSWWRLQNKYDLIKFKRLKWYAPRGFYTYAGDEQVLCKSQTEAHMLNWEASQCKQRRCCTAVYYGQHKRRKEKDTIVAVYK